MHMSRLIRGADVAMRLVFVAALHNQELFVYLHTFIQRKEYYSLHLLKQLR